MSTTKRDLVMKIAEDTKKGMKGKNEQPLTQQQVYDVIQATLNYITESLAKGDNVELRNFGVFEVRERKQRVGRNPNKPEQVVTIPSRKVVKFKPGKIMRQQVSDGIAAVDPNADTVVMDGSSQTFSKSGSGESVGIDSPGASGES